MGQQRPYDARIFVGQRNGRHIFVSPIDDAVDPTACLRLLACLVDNGSRPMYQQGSEVGVATLADT